MDQALTIARSGLEAQHKHIEIISNNLANANTTAFKRNRAEFTDLPYQIIQQPGAPIVEGDNAISGLVQGTGTKLAGNKKIFQDGTQIQTNNALDLQIVGRGFFQVQMPNGSQMAYTRAGNFTLNQQMQLTTQDGYVVQPPLTIPQGYTNISISEDGIVSATVSGTITQVGQLQTADFLNTDGLQPIGDNLYLETLSSGAAVLGTPTQNSYGKLLQGSLEGSNVNVVQEMVDLIEAQRAFEVTSKAVSTVDSMLSNLTRTT